MTSARTSGQTRRVCSIFGTHRADGVDLSLLRGHLTGHTSPSAHPRPPPVGFPCRARTATMRRMEWKVGDGEERARRAVQGRREVGAKALWQTTVRQPHVPLQHVTYATPDLLLKHPIVIFATYVWRQMKYLKYVCETLAKTHEKHLKNIRNIQIKHL